MKTRNQCDHCSMLTKALCSGCWCQADARAPSVRGTPLEPREQMFLLPLMLGRGLRFVIFYIFVDQVRIHPLLTGGWFGLDGHQQCTGDGSGLLNRSLNQTVSSHLSQDAQGICNFLRPYKLHLLRNKCDRYPNNLLAS